jgi:hypothetical protein
MLQARFLKKGTEIFAKRKKFIRRAWSKERRSNVEDDGERQKGRHENRQGVEALARCNDRDGRKTRRVPEYAGITVVLFLLRFTPWSSMVA